MSCLEATFTLTPRSPFHSKSPRDWSELECHGADFSSGWCILSSLYASDLFYFDGAFASDPNLDYTQWANRKKARYLQLYMDLGDYGAQKQIALIFGFNVPWSFSGRVLVYSDAGLIQDQTLSWSDNQFMVELESVDQRLYLYFIVVGGPLFFKGISGYVV